VILVLFDGLVEKVARVLESMLHAMWGEFWEMAWSGKGGDIFCGSKWTNLVFGREERLLGFVGRG
jgi:hypothetical protein